MSWRYGRKRNRFVWIAWFVLLVVVGIVALVDAVFPSKKADTEAWADSASEVAYTYVLNTNTKRIHQPTCSSVLEMADHNRKYSHKTIEELESEGYVKCQRCFG